MCAPRLAVFGLSCGLHSGLVLGCEDDETALFLVSCQNQRSRLTLTFCRISYVTRSPVMRTRWPWVPAGSCHQPLTARSAPVLRAAVLGHCLGNSYHLFPCPGGGSVEEPTPKHRTVTACHLDISGDRECAIVTGKWALFGAA